MRRLRHTANTKVVMNSDEELFVNGWSIIDSEVTRLQQRSLVYQKKGKAKLADLTNQAANYYIYLFYYGFFLRRRLDRQGLIEDSCTATILNENTKIECVEENLLCLSANLNTDYVSAWKKLLVVFGITRQTAGCETDCCVGIGEMIIGHEDDCKAFIIGPCELPEEPEELAEYEDCVFDNGHTTADDEASCETNNCN